ncbi:hypothetical protein L810_6262 [Burkholderia sp. AU4i]|nr:hypothetical protein L810_6262 [Burkholderia sp. AU4i]
MDQAGRGSAHGRPARCRAGAGVRAGTARRRAKRAAGSVGRLRRMVSPPGALASFGRRLDDADGAGRMGKHQCCFGTIVLVFGPNRRFEGFSA